MLEDLSAWLTKARPCLPCLSDAQGVVWEQKIIMAASHVTEQKWIENGKIIQTAEHWQKLLELHPLASDKNKQPNTAPHLR